MKGRGSTRGSFWQGCVIKRHGDAGGSELPPSISTIHGFAHFNPQQNFHDTISIIII